MPLLPPGILVPVGHASGHANGENVRMTIPIEIMRDREEKIGVVPDVKGSGRRVGVTFPKIRSRVPIGPGNNILGAISIDISEAGPLAEELFREDQAFEAVYGGAGLERGYGRQRKRREDGKTDLLAQSAW